MKTPEEIVGELFDRWGDQKLEGSLEDALAAAIRAAVAEEREACALIVQNGGDGKTELLELCIQYGTNAALAALIRARGKTP